MIGILCDDRAASTHEQISYRWQHHIHSCSIYPPVAVFLYHLILCTIWLWWNCLPSYNTVACIIRITYKFIRCFLSPEDVHQSQTKESERLRIEEILQASFSYNQAAAGGLNTADHSAGSNIPLHNNWHRNSTQKELLKWKPTNWNGRSIAWVMSLKRLICDGTRSTHSKRKTRMKAMQSSLFFPLSDNYQSTSTRVKWFYCYTTNQPTNQPTQVVWNLLNCIWLPTCRSLLWFLKYLPLTFPCIVKTLSLTHLIDIQLVCKSNYGTGGT